MSTDTLLPGMPSDTAGGRKTDGQWTLARLQLINWGGFDGYHDCEFNHRGNLLSGASGTGKSTVLDAYIALMMESNIPFNGASNDSGTGRARGEKQRNLLSYMRGLTDTTRDEHSDEARERVLRGDGQATWSAIAATWQHTDGSRHTGMRVYYAAANATSANDVQIHFAQCIGEFNIRNLEPFAAERFHHRKVNGRYPNLVFSESYPKWCHRLHVRLGIGRDGDGTQALRLLARIQAGRTITSVDGLFKEMVLEKPRTYDAAEQAVEHFSELETAYVLMCTAHEQIDTLRPIVEMHTALEQARTQYELLDTFGLGAASPHGPVPLWAARTEQRLLEAETAAAKQRRDTAERDEHTADADVRGLRKQLLENEQLQRDSGGDALAALALRCEELDATLGTIRSARAEFGPRAPMHTLPVSAAELDALQDQARSTLAGWDELKDSLEQEARALGKEQWPLEDQRSKTEAEIRYLQDRNNLVPPRLDEARQRIAEHLGLDPAELPFVAELIDLQPEHESWREAAELLLGGIARTMLVDRRHTQFRRHINDLRLRERVNFNLVAVDLPRTDMDEIILPGRLQYADDSPFTGWLQAEFAKSYAYLCLDTPEFPADGRKAITITGQIQNGSRGAHGGHGGVKILGFSNAARLEELGRQHTDLEQQLAAVETRTRTLQTRTRRRSRQGRRRIPPQPHLGRTRPSRHPGAARRGPGAARQAPRRQRRPRAAPARARAPRRRARAATEGPGPRPNRVREQRQALGRPHRAGGRRQPRARRPRRCRRPDQRRAACTPRRRVQQAHHGHNDQPRPHRHRRQDAPGTARPGRPRDRDDQGQGRCSATHLRVLPEDLAQPQP
jgi:uncharacterized protein YPO0396